MREPGRKSARVLAFTALFRIDVVDQGVYLILRQALAERGHNRSAKFDPDFHILAAWLAMAHRQSLVLKKISPLANRSAENWCRFVGGRIGAEAVKVLLSMEPGHAAPVKSESKLLHIKRRPPSSQRVAQALEIVAQDPKKVDATQWTFAKEIVLLNVSLSKEPVADVEVQAVQVGPAVFLTDPAEYFCQFGLDIKAGSKFPFTFPVELANGCVGYVPTEEALGPRGGGYETRLTSYSNLEPTAGRQIADAAIELAAKLQPGTVPARPPSAALSQRALELRHCSARIELRVQLSAATCGTPSCPSHNTSTK